MIYLLTACSEYELHPDEGPAPPSCLAVEDRYAFCDGPVPFAVAAGACEELGAVLLDATAPPDPHGEQDHVGLLGAELFDDGYWWVGWPDTYRCPAMNVYGGSTPRGCLELHPFACKWPEGDQP